jgi:hypothetical protein
MRLRTWSFWQVFLTEVIGVDSLPRSVMLTAGNIQHKLAAAPNQVVGLDGAILKAAPFDYPDHDLRKTVPVDKIYSGRSGSE